MNGNPLSRGIICTYLHQVLYMTEGILTRIYLYIDQQNTAEAGGKSVKFTVILNMLGILLSNVYNIGM